MATGSHRAPHPDPFLRREPVWTFEECVVAWAACPKSKQSYGPAHPIVIEVADLLGRTPAAVSLKFANLWATHTKGERGFSHTSHNAKAVVSEYRGQYERLHDDAERLRTELFEVGPTIRAERTLPADTAPSIGPLIVERLLFRHGWSASYVEFLPPARVAALLRTEPLRFRRAGSGIEGLLFPFSWVLQHPVETLDIAGGAYQLLGKRIRESVAFRYARERKLDSVLTHELSVRIPDLDVTALVPADRKTLAARLVELKVTRVLTTKSIERMADRLDVTAERRRVREFFMIDADELPRLSLALLTSVIDRVLRRR
jgi:hypothetical protein